MFGRIQNKFDEAINDGLKYIEVEHSELDLMRNAFQDGMLPAAWASNATKMEDSILEAMKDETEIKPKTKTPK